MTDAVRNIIGRAGREAGIEFPDASAHATTTTTKSKRLFCCAASSSPLGRCHVSVVAALDLA
jgi:hypothetical protein